jgi:hypothetical protein
MKNLLRIKKRYYQQIHKSIVLIVKPGLFKPGFFVYTSRRIKESHGLPAGRVSVLNNCLSRQRIISTISSKQKAMHSHA